MLLSNVKSTTLVRDYLRIDQRSIFLMIPDTNINVVESIYNTGLLLSNSIGLITPIKVFSTGTKRFLTKTEYYDLKKQFIQLSPQSGKKLKVLTPDILSKKDESETENFYLYNCKVLVDMYNFYLTKFPPKIATVKFLQDINNMYKEVHNSNPDRQVYIMFMMKDSNGTLIHLFQNLKMSLSHPDVKDGLTLCDKYAFVNFLNKTSLPIIENNSGVASLIFPNLGKILRVLNIETDEEATIKDKEEKVISSLPKDESKSVLEQPKKTLRTHSVINDDKEIIKNKVPVSTASKLVQSLTLPKKVEINIAPPPKKNAKPITKKAEVVSFDSKLIEKVLKKHSIDDPDIAAGISLSLQKSRTIVTTKETLERNILKAANYAVNGTYDLTEEQLAHPETIFKQLQYTKTFQVPLNFPRTKTITSPSDVIGLKYTTGQFRQQIEFTKHIHDNVYNLFQSLETSGKYPIKVLGITYENKDNNSDRFLKYKIKLQNMVGGYKKPYEVTLNVPSPVNDKYFKIHNNFYIISSQQFLKPVTKTDKKEVRLISNYGVVRVSIQNLKFSPSDIEDVIRYTKLKYPNLIKSEIDGEVTFSDDTKLFLDGNILYTENGKSIYIDTNNKFIGLEGEQVQKGKYEILYEKVLEKISKINPTDKLTKTKKSIPFFQIYLVSYRLPLIYYLWMQKGLKATLHDFGIDYEEVKTAPKDSITVPLANGNFLLIKPDSLKEELLANGLLFHKIRRPIHDTEDVNEIIEWVADLHGPKAIRTLNLVTENHVDPITYRLLDLENLPKNLPGLAKLSTDIVMNQKTDSLANLNLYRARLSELVLQIMYKQIKKAHSAYISKAELNDEESKLEIFPDFIINSLLGSATKSSDENVNAGFIQNTNPVSPVEEIMLSSRLIKSGKGGINEKRAFKSEHRNVHPSQYGIVSATSTPESDKVGIITHLTLTPLIINRYGSFGFKDIDAISGWKMLAMDEALIPFQNHIDSSRLTMANIHQKQVTPRDHLEVPLVQTGAEYIVPQLASRRFVQTAKTNGTVVNVEKNRIVTVQYDNGDIENFDILPRLSMTKRGSYIFLEMQTLGEGEKFVANQPIAFTKNFNKQGIYCSGKNLNFAIVNYMGLAFEDSYVVSKEIADTLTTDSIQEVSTIIPPDATLLTMRTAEGECKNGETLVEFSYGQSLDDYLLNFKVDIDEGEDTISSLYSQGKDTIKLLAPKGEIVNYQILLNSKTNVDKKVVMYHKDLVDRTNETRKDLEKSMPKENKVQAVDNLNLAFMKVGGHKYKNEEFPGARIVYYIKTKRPLIVGDKIATRQGAKGVIGKLLDKTPKGEFTDKIDVFISPVGVFSRKNLVLVKELYLGKIMFHLNKKIVDMANDSKTNTAKIVQLILDVMHLVSAKDIADSLEKNLSKMTETSLRAALKKDQIKLYCIVRPFENISFSNIKTAAKVLNIPLDEKVYIPDIDKWTDPVPVGVSYFLFLEHMSDVYASVRGSEKYIGLTGRPTKGKKRLGAQGIGNLDINALSSYNIPSVMDEILGPKSDQHKSKRALYNQIISSGVATLADTRVEEVGGTRELLQVYLRGLGLNIEQI